MFAAAFAAAWLAVLGQVLFGPAAAPIFEMHRCWLGHGALEMNHDAMNLPRILPHHPVAFGERQPDRRHVQRRAGQRENPKEQGRGAEAGPPTVIRG